MRAACKEGLKFARLCSVQRVHLETDCFELVQLWKLAERFGVSPAVEAVEERQRSIIMPMLQEAKELGRSFQAPFRISHVGRCW